MAPLLAPPIVRWGGFTAGADKPTGGIGMAFDLLRIAAEEHPVFRLFAGGAFGDPVDGRFTQRLRLPEGFAAS